MNAIIYQQSRNCFTLAEHATAILYAVNEFGAAHTALELASGALLIFVVLLIPFKVGERIQRLKATAQRKGN
jgi:hypothetical protein